MKRRRENSNDDLCNRFDLTRDFPPLIHPEKLTLDIDAVNALMVGAAELVPAVREKAEGVDVPEDTRLMAKFGLSLFMLLESIVEKAVRPMATAPSFVGGGAAGGKIAPPPPPKPDAMRRELVDALALADRTAVIHDANLGTVPIANRQKLNHALSSGIREAALRKAETAGADPAEAVRIADDALSLVKDMTFLGQVSKKVKNLKRPELDYMTLPIKLEFEDRNARIHFERTMLTSCNIRASMSLPKNIRTAQKKFQDAIRAKYPEEITMVRTDTKKMCFIAFHKEDGGPKWLQCHEWEGISPDVLREGGTAVSLPVDDPAAAATPMVED